MSEPTHAHPIHCALKNIRQTRLDGSKKSLSDRITSQLLISSSKISLQLYNLGLKVSNNLGKINWLWLQHGCSILFDNFKRGVPSTHTHTTPKGVKATIGQKELPKPFVTFA